MDKDNVLVFPDALTRGASGGIDPNLMLALNQNGGFGGNGAWIWILFLWMMWQRNGGNGNFNDYVAQFGAEGRQYLAEIMNGRFDNINTLAQIVNTNVETVKNGIFTLQNSISQVGASVGLTAAQTQNAIALGDAALSRQLCECCCNMRYDLAQQTNTLQAQAANNFASSQLQAAQNQAATQLQMAQIESADQLAVCQQTNALATQADRNTNSIVKAIADQNAMIVKEFCDLKERELQNKIDSLTADNALLRSNANNMVQTQQFAAMLAPINAELAAIKAHQPQTITLPYNQYAVVPSWAANVGADFVASYWANRLHSATTSTTAETA